MELHGNTLVCLLVGFEYAFKALHQDDYTEQVEDVDYMVPLLSQQNA